jgi:hypothetical protein
VVDHRADARLVDEHRHERLLAREVRQDPLDHDRAALGSRRGTRSDMPPVASSPSTR